jgi:hypothetical protein
MPIAVSVLTRSGSGQEVWLGSLGKDMQPRQQHGVHVQEAGGEDPGGLGMQELPPRRTRPARRRVDARGTQDLPDGRRRDRHAELRQLAVDPAVSPQRVLFRQAHRNAGDAPDRRRPARLAPPAASNGRPIQPIEYSSGTGPKGFGLRTESARQYFMRPACN